MDVPANLHKPLRGKAIYIDVFRHNDRCKSLERKLQFLGATVEECFSKDVSHVVTALGEPSAHFQSTRRAFGMLNEVSPSGPFSMKCGLGSSVSNGSSNSIPNKMSRGQIIADKVDLTKTHGTTDVIECAHKWGMKIISLTKVEKWVQAELNKVPIEELARLSPSEQHMVQGFSEGKKSFRLTSPFIKVEAVGKCYRPMCKTLDDFAQIDLTLPPGTCPFSKAEKESGEQKMTGRHWKHQKPRNVPLKKSCLMQTPGPVMLEVDDTKKSFGGQCECQLHCEICRENFEKLSTHVATARHKKFLHNVNNYISLDSVIAEVCLRNQHLWPG